jgi:outer membrane protein OmpA-like peptidoglycan-associated protein
MNRLGWHFCGLLLLLSTANAGAQVPAGNGLQGDYYTGREFNTLVMSRRDPAINFDWNGGKPVPGVPAEDFSVRWTGWLVPPVTGRYVLHISVDDGIRLWLNGRQLLNEWRGQSLSYYQLEVDLKAGEPYSLRIDYCQYGYSTRARLAWSPPPGLAGDSKWRSLWGLATPTDEPVIIPARYLFSRLPKVPLPRPAAPVASRPPTPAEVPKVVAPRPAIPTVAALAPQPAQPKPRRMSYLPTVRAMLAPVVVPATQPTPVPAPVAQPVPALAARPVSAISPAEASRTALLATRLASGQAVTLRDLYFEQGQADLLPAVRASLDTLAQALASNPTLRFEVQGHTDNQGDPTINQQLSRRRAEAVCHYLVAHGVAATRLRALGYGGSRPVADNRNPAQRPRNRRVVLRPLTR